MKKQELTNKSDAETKKQVLQGKSTQRRPELCGYKLVDYSNNYGVESSPDCLISALTSSEFSNILNESQKVNIFYHLQQTYGNANMQRMIQAKLKIGQPNDKFEQEADMVADRVMRMPDHKVKREPGKEKSLQTRALPTRTTEVTSDLEDRINTIRGNGQPLHESERAFFEPRLGHDLGKVRIHTSRNAEKTARALNALAYTSAHDIVFRHGAYQPNSVSGRRLLAHELTHVLQQTCGLGVNKAITKVMSNYMVIQKQIDYTNPHQSGEQIVTYAEEIIPPSEKIIIGAIDELVDMIAEEAIPYYKYAKAAARLAKAFGEALEGSLRHSRQRLIKIYGEITAEPIIKVDKAGRVIEAAGEEERIRRIDFVTDWQANWVNTIPQHIKESLHGMIEELEKIIIEEIADIAVGDVLKKIGGKIGDFIGDFLTGDYGIIPEDFISQRFEDIVEKSVGAVSTAFAKSFVEYSIEEGVKETKVMGLVIEKFPEAIGPPEAGKLFSEKAQLEWVLKSFGDKEEKLRTLLDENEKRTAIELCGRILRLIQMYKKGADEEKQKEEARKIRAKLRVLQSDIWHKVNLDRKYKDFFKMEIDILQNIF